MQQVTDSSGKGSPYRSIRYDYRDRFLSYWDQINEITSRLSPGQKILEVGPGTNFVNGYLRKHGLCIETLDITNDSSPDHLGSVTEIPLPSKQYEIAVCYEVLEHLPFSSFATALRELARVSRSFVIFSVPDVRYYFQMNLSLLGSRGTFHQLLSMPRLFKRELPPQPAGGHVWELGRPGYPLKKIIRAIPPELKLSRHYRVVGNPLHHMFVCEVR